MHQFMGYVHLSSLLLEPESQSLSPVRQHHIHFILNLEYGIYLYSSESADQQAMQVQISTATKSHVI